MSSEKNPTRAQFAAYERLYNYFNRALFGGRLKPVLLNFSRHAGSVGFFAPERWEGHGGATHHEISLNPTWLKLRSLRDTASTLVHEQVHCWQHEQGSPGRRGYHNEEWAAKMEEIGLMPSDTRAPGGKRVGYKVSHYIIDGGAFDRAFAAMPKDLTLPFLCFDGIPGKGKGAKRAASKVKFSCPDCGANAWGKPSLRLSCGGCDVAMVAEGATDGDVDADAELTAAA
jgi:hypothetical protein